MSPFILGYKTHGLNFMKVYKDKDKFIYPKHIPFFNVNLNPDMSVYEDRIKCSKKLEFFNFRILIQSDKNYVKNMIELTDDKYNFVKLVEKKDFFLNYNYDLKQSFCSKKLDYYFCVQMKGDFLCLDNNKNGYKRGFKGDYLIKINNKFYIETEEDFNKKYYIYPIIKKEPKRNKRHREIENDVFLNNKKLALEKDKTFYKFIDKLQTNSICNLHTNQITIKLYYPVIKCDSNNIIINDYNYIINTNKDTFPKIEIYDKKNKNRITTIVTEFFINIGNYYDYFISWYYYLISISKFISNSLF